MAQTHPIVAALQDRILLVDGAMGTMIQAHELEEEDFRGSSFADHPNALKGNNDLLSITQPEIIADIHRRFLDAGSDIISTNTFNSTSISMADYAMEAEVYNINVPAARLANKVVAEFNEREPSKPRYVLGVLGPTNKTLSISPDVNDPGFRGITWAEMVAPNQQQCYQHLLCYFAMP